MNLRETLESEHNNIQPRIQILALLAVPFTVVMFPVWVAQDMMDAWREGYWSVMRRGR